MLIQTLSIKDKIRNYHFEDIQTSFQKLKIKLEINILKLSILPILQQILHQNKQTDSQEKKNTKRLY